MTRLVAQRRAASLSLLLLSCSGPAEDAPRPGAPWFSRSPLGALPAKLSDVGIYKGSDVSAPLAPARAYEPRYPLWSDGGQKFRSLVLPESTHIEAKDPQNYVFPVGTLICKTFSYMTPTHPNETLFVETRLLRLNTEGWELAAYAWDDAATDAELLDLKRGQTRPVLSEDGDVVLHAIPSRLECRQCHESSTSEVLGINELQLAESGLSELSESLEPPPQEPLKALPSHGPLTTSVLGYFVGNCVHCHNGTNGAASSFDLRPDAALANIIAQPTASSATADGLRVTPGRPDESILYLGVKGGTDLEVKDMPPLGVAKRDAQAVQLLGDWISALEMEKDP